MSEEIQAPPPSPPPKPPKHELLTRAEERALNALEKKAHPDLGRDFLLDKLLHVPDVSPDEERLLALISDPANQKRGLASLCSDAGFSVARFLKFLQRASGAQALLTSMERVYAKGADVAGDTMELARIREFPCGFCLGEGEVLDKEATPQVMRKCTDCGGQGKVIREPSVQQQKLALQLMGMLAQGAGISIPISVSQTANPVAVSEARSASSSALVDHKFMDSLRANTDAAVRKARELKPGAVAALPPAPVIEAAFVSVPESASVPAAAAAVGGASGLGGVQAVTARTTGTEAGPRAVIPQLGIPSGVRRPPPSTSSS